MEATKVHYLVRMSNLASNVRRTPSAESRRSKTSLRCCSTGDDPKSAAGAIQEICSDGMHEDRVLVPRPGPRLGLLDWVTPGLNGPDACRVTREFTLLEMVAK
jgi:DNA-binding response OmpR family regulator